MILLLWLRIMPVLKLQVEMFAEWNLKSFWIAAEGTPELPRVTGASPGFSHQSRPVSAGFLNSQPPKGSSLSAPAWTGVTTVKILLHEVLRHRGQETTEYLSAACSLCPPNQMQLSGWILELKSRSESRSQEDALKWNYENRTFFAHLFSASVCKAVLAHAWWDVMALTLSDASKMTCGHGFFFFF